MVEPVTAQPSASPSVPPTAATTLEVEPVTAQPSAPPSLPPTTATTPEVDPVTAQPSASLSLRPTAAMTLEVDPVTAQPSASPSLPPTAAMTLEVVSKSVAAFAIILYGCGFLITSIYHASYGFSETNPLRPRIVSAGAWFFLFMALPFALVSGFMKSKEYIENKDKWWAEVHILLPRYIAASYLLQLLFGWPWIFDFYEFEHPHQPAEKLHLLAPLFGLMLWIVAGQTALLWKRVPKYVLAFITIAGSALIILGSVYSTVYKRQFRLDAILLWFLVGGIIVYFEGNRRSWRPILGYWPRTTFFIFAALLAFATFYYPHINSSWGGGTPIPVTIYFTKDSTIMPSLTVSAFLIDESDSGLYIIGKADKKATFIPRSAIGVVHFSDDLSDSSLFKK